MPDQSISDDRLARLPFFIFNLALLVVSVLTYLLLWPNFLSVGIAFYVMLYQIRIIIMRLHDLDLSGWFCLLIVFPVTNLVLWLSLSLSDWLFLLLVFPLTLIDLFFGLYLNFAKGTTGRNAYGADPLQ